MAISEDAKTKLQYAIAEALRDKLLAIGLPCSEVEETLDWTSWYKHLCAGYDTTAFSFEVRRTGTSVPPYRFQIKCSGPICSLFVPGVYYSTFEFADPRFPDGLIAELVELLVPKDRWRRLWCRIMHDHEYVGYSNLHFDKHLYICDRCLQFFNTGLLRQGRRFYRIKPTSVF